MVLGTLGDSKPSQPGLLHESGRQVRLDVDLAYLLFEYGVAGQYLTTALSVDASDYGGATRHPSTPMRRESTGSLQAAARVEVVRRSLTAIELWNLMWKRSSLHSSTTIPFMPESRTANRPAARRAGRRASSYANDLAALAEDSCGLVRPHRALLKIQRGRAVHLRPRRKQGGAKTSSRSASCIDLASLAEEADADLGSASIREHGKHGGRSADRRSSSHVDLTSLASQQEVHHGGESASFAGHYILILGVDDGRSGFIINDPAHDDERRFIPADALEAARHAHGTDEDLI